MLYKPLWYLKVYTRCVQVQNLFILDVLEKHKHTNFHFSLHKILRKTDQKIRQIRALGRI